MNDRRAGRLSTKRGERGAPLRPQSGDQEWSSSALPRSVEWFLRRHVERAVLEPGFPVIRRDGTFLVEMAFSFETTEESGQREQPYDKRQRSTESDNRHFCLLGWSCRFDVHRGGPFFLEAYDRPRAVARRRNSSIGEAKLSQIREAVVAP